MQKRFQLSERVSTFNEVLCGHQLVRRNLDDRLVADSNLAGFQVELEGGGGMADAQVIGRGANAPFSFTLAEGILKEDTYMY